MTNLGPIGGAPDPTTAPEVYTGMRKLHADQGYSQAKQPVQFLRGGPSWRRRYAGQIFPTSTRIVRVAAGSGQPTNFEASAKFTSLGYSR